MATSLFDDRDKLSEAVSACTSLTQVIRHFFPEHTRGAGHYKTVKRYIKKYELSTEHFKPMDRTHGLKRHTDRLTIPLQEILEGKHPNYPTTHLKNRLLKDGVLIEQCVKCRTGPEWNGEPLTLQLDHKDGDSSNHRLHNLQIMCPNCHSQTSTFCKGKSQAKRSSLRSRK